MFQVQLHWDSATNFGCKTGVHLGVLETFSCLKSTHPSNFLYSFWVWCNEWIIILEKILLSLKIVIHDHYQFHTCDTHSNKILPCTLNCVNRILATRENIILIILQKKESQIKYDQMKSFLRQIQQFQIF